MAQIGSVAAPEQRIVLAYGGDLLQEGQRGPAAGGEIGPIEGGHVVVVQEDRGLEGAPHEVPEEGAALSRGALNADREMSKR